MAHQYGVLIALAVFVIGAGILALIGIREIQKEDKEAHQKEIH